MNDILRLIGTSDQCLAGFGCLGGLSFLFNSLTGFCLQSVVSFLYFLLVSIVLFHNIYT